MATLLRPLQGCAAAVIGEARVCAVQGQLPGDGRVAVDRRAMEVGLMVVVP